MVEVGPRDGLQNTSGVLATPDKVKFVDALSAAGCGVVEVTSFVNPTAVPHLADAAEVMSAITRREGVRYVVLVPNLRGLDRAIEAGASEVAIFASATESFSEKNLGRSRDEVATEFRSVCERAAAAGAPVRGYLSMVIADPWEGPTPVAEVLAEAIDLLEMGCYEVSLGDTIGVGTPSDVENLLAAFDKAGIEKSLLAVHFHDTYGQALVNVRAALAMGITTVDSSAGGLGGCPFAKSATGNLATEDLVFMLDGLGVETGIDVTAVARASRDACDSLGIEVPSRAARALLGGI